ncbi:Gfo/Idh/MocA family protein [Candidatus Hydrogenedentota bacterium]
MNKRYNIGVIGCGMIWRNKHSVALREELSGRATIIAVHDVDDQAAEEAGKTCGARVCDDWREIVDDPDVDIVVSCTPPHVRAEHAVAAAYAGKHLMLEKPLARETNDARAIEEAVRQNGVQCVVAFFRSVSAAAQQIVRDVRDNGPLGKVVQFYHHDYGPPYPWLPDFSHWMFDKSRSGGPLMDYSCHFIEFALALFDCPVTSVWSEGERFVHDLPGDDTGTMVIGFGERGQALFTKSWTAPRRSKTTSSSGIVTTKGMLEMVGQSFSGNIDGEEINVEGENRRALSYEALFDAIEGKPVSCPGVGDGRRITELLCKAFESQKTGTRLTVNI